jgi:hypothetical protein
MKNKNGFLLPESVTKILIAIIVLLFLFYAFYMIFGLIQDRAEYETATEHFTNIAEQIDILEEKPEDYPNSTYFLNSPNDWFLVGWPRYEPIIGTKITDRPGEIDTDIVGWQTSDIPSTCKGQRWSYCLCMCPSLKEESCKVCEGFEYPVKTYAASTGMAAGISVNNVLDENLIIEKNGEEVRIYPE